jgi:hypothetical protein
MGECCTQAICTVAGKPSFCGEAFPSSGPCGMGGSGRHGWQELFNSTKRAEVEHTLCEAVLGFWEERPLT